MPRPGRLICVRSLVAALCGLAGLCLLTPAAEAGGCHAAYRPEIAFTFAGPASPTLDRPAAGNAAVVEVDALPPALRPVPCPGDTPGNPSRDLSRCVTIAGLLVAAPPVAPGGRTTFLLSSDDDASAEDDRRLDRPPRPVSPRL